MAHEDNPPIRPGKRFKGGWNPNPGRKDPTFVPAPFGIPFEPAPPVGPSDALSKSAGSGGHGETGAREPVPPIRPGKAFKGGWNPDPPERPRNIVPAPFGIPFDRPPRFP